MSISRSIFFGAFVLLLLSLFTVMVRVAPFLHLDPSLVMSGEWWRVITYPLVPALLDLLVVAMAFSIPGEEIEAILGKQRFGLLLIASVILNGLLHLAVAESIGSNVVLIGSACLSLPVLVAYLYLFPYSGVRVFIFTVPAWGVLAIAGVLSLTSPLVELASGGSALPLLTSGLGPMILGLIYAHVRFQKYPVLLRTIRRFSYPRAEPQQRRRSAVMAGVRQQRGVAVRVRAAQPQRWVREENEPGSDEERMNALLDKINERGYEALSEAERKFLEEYARRL